MQWQYNSDLEALKNNIASVVSTAGDEALSGMAQVVYGFTRISVPSTDKEQHEWSWKVDETNPNRMIATCSKCDIKKYKDKETDEGGTEEGSFEKEAEVGADSLIETATLNNKKEALLDSNIFGAGEKEQIISGNAAAKVWIVINKTDISDTEKASVEEAAKTAVGNSDNIIYFDATLFKQVGNAPQSPVAEPGVQIEITIKIPGGLINKDSTKTRTYKIIRVHNGVAETINGSYDKTTGEFTFKTDKFSTYAIVYSDTSNPSSDYGSGSPVTPAVPVTDVKVSSAGQTLTKKGETMKLTVDFTPSNATDKKVTWSSSDPKVATVDENGTVTAVGNGTAIITAKTSNGKTATITITVKTEAESENPTEDKPAESGDNEVTVDNRFAAFRMASAKATKTTNTLTWKKIADADGYVVYGAPCNTRGKINKLKKLSVIKDGEATTYKAAGLKSGTYYKYVIKAYKLVDGKKVYLAKSKTIHVTTAGGNYGNAKAVKVNKTSVSLKTGKTFAIKASMVKEDKTIKQHTAIKYESSDSSVAAVNSKGVITAKGTGNCYIYAYAQNGVYKKVKVTVK